MRFGCSFTQEWHIGGLKMLTFEIVFQIADFWKQYRYRLRVIYKNAQCIWNCVRVGIAFEFISQLLKEYVL